MQGVREYFSNAGTVDKENGKLRFQILVGEIQFIGLSRQETIIRTL